MHVLQVRSIQAAFLLSGQAKQTPRNKGRRCVSSLCRPNHWQLFSRRPLFVRSSWSHRIRAEGCRQIRHSSRTPEPKDPQISLRKSALKIGAGVLLGLALVFAGKRVAHADEKKDPPQPPVVTEVVVMEEVKPEDSRAAESVVRLDQSEAGKGESRLIVPREHLDMYYLPEQVPRPREGSSISDQVGSLQPSWGTVRIDQVSATLRRTTKADITVVALKSLGEHAGVPETFAHNLFNYWGIKPDGALVLLVEEGGRSWHKTSDRVETDVPYSGGVSVILGSSLEEELGGPIAREGVANLKRETWDPLCREGKPGEALLEAVAVLAERTWDARGMKVPKEVTEHNPVSWIAKALKGLLMLAAFVIALNKIDPEGTLQSNLELANSYFWWRLDRIFKARGPRCLVCQKGMRPVREALPEDLEEKGMVVEKRIKSADYWVYECQEKGCSGPKEDRVVVLLMRRPFAPHVCPDCGFHTLTLRRKTKQLAGVFKDGVVHEVGVCENCGHNVDEDKQSSSLWHSLWPGRREKDVVDEPSAPIVEGAIEGV